MEEYSTTLENTGIGMSGRRPIRYEGKQTIVYYYSKLEAIFQEVVSKPHLRHNLSATLDFLAKYQFGKGFDEKAQSYFLCPES
jgi:hypothetical protein